MTPASVESVDINISAFAFSVTRYMAAYVEKVYDEASFASLGMS